MKNFRKHLLGFLILFFGALLGQAQELNGVYFNDSQEETDTSRQELKIYGNYLVLSDYATSPATFHKTMGGFFEVKNDSIQMNLEFNSNYATDSIQSMKLPISISKNEIRIGAEKFKRSTALPQDVDGQWLFGTRGPDIGQERRGDSRSRKTLKFLLDGRFQWIAFDTEGVQFKGSGGGSYTAIDGKYTEHIEYFSRDNNRVGAALEFNYDLKENDWHHTGKNSKGAPMYEIWQRRE